MNLLSEVLSAEESNDFERIEGLMCGAVKYLHSNRSKPDQIAFLTLMHLAKVKPNVFTSEIVIEVSFLSFFIVCFVKMFTHICVWSDC